MVERRHRPTPPAEPVVPVERIASDDTLARLGRLEARLAALEARVDGGGHDDGSPGHRPSAPVIAPAPAADDDDPYFALHALQARISPPGAVLYTGSVDLPAGHVEWQYALPAGALLDDDWSERVPAIAALSHPVRLRILQLILEEVRTVTDLVELAEMGTTGQVYHHIRQLTATGWLESAGRGRYRVPATRVIPLLTILLATR